MKRIQYALLFAGLCFAAYAGENLIQNGDFQKNKSRWSGDLDIKTEGENKFAEVEVDEDKPVSFYQKVVLEEPKELIVRFRIRKSDDYGGSGVFSIYLDDDAGATVARRDVPGNTEWNQMEVRFYNLRELKRCRIRFAALEGIGTLYFDDIIVMEKE